ncbi:MAG: SDR family NAD(P)-dependent oxidoreductase [Actinobacteria bacterium]|nr:SDR family NAD(P)-dependent oxidoreductase [Actinomycetota bacterium]
MRLINAVVLVTGASSGIGEATATRLAATGANLIVTGRNEERLRDVATRTGATPVTADLTEPGGPDLLVEKALAAEGRVDVLICNAGAGWAGPIGELAGPKARELVSLNLLAPVQLARLLAPQMAERGSGRLVFVSSIAGACGVRNEAVYSATKAGLNNLAESLSYELTGTGVGVSLVLPGVVDTPFFGRRGRPYTRRMPVPIPAERVASAINRVLVRDMDVVYVPGWLRFPAWVHGVAPGTFRRLAIRFS